MQDFNYYRPQTTAELKENLKQPGARLLAGGTDIIPKIRRGVFTPEVLVDASGLEELRFIKDQGDRIAIGALTTHQDIASSELVALANPPLQKAAESVGCIQTRCRGTLGGNIANASPAADTVPALLLYDAVVLVQCLEGERTISLESFIQGPGLSDLQDGEYIHSVSFQPFAGRWGASFLKIGKRAGMAVAVVNTACALVLDEGGKISKARIALGAVGPIVVRCRDAERFLEGKLPEKAIFVEAGDRAREEIRPITDVRSTLEYRLHSAGVIVDRALADAAEQAVVRDQ